MKKNSFILIILFISISCFADDEDIDPYGWCVSPGFAYAYHNDKDYLLGAEISLFNSAYSFNPFSSLFYGIYFDIFYDSQLEAIKYSIGPELGITPFGIDGGLIILNSNSQTNYGYSFRTFITLPPVGCCHGFGPPFLLYYRYNNIPEIEDYHEFGILWKLPIPLKRFSFK